MEQTEIIRAYRVRLNPSPVHAQMLAKHAGAARTLYNWAVAQIRDAHFRRIREHAWATYTTFADDDPDTASARAWKAINADASLRVPTKTELSRRFTTERGDESADIDGIFPWWRGINRHAIVHALGCACDAYAAYWDSRTGRRAGERLGLPRFKKKSSGVDTFRIFHDVKKPSIRVEDARHLRIPNIGAVKLGGNLRRLRKRINRGRAQIQSVAVRRSGERWYAAVFVKEQIEFRTRPTRAQRRGGSVGVDWGVQRLATLSDGTGVPNPRYLRQAQQRLARAQRDLARTQPGSQGRRRARRRVASIHAQVAERRSQALHRLTKHLVTNHELVSIEDLAPKGMSSSARGTLERPGRKVAQKAGLNRAVLDAAFGELRRQLIYKARWYGSAVEQIDRWAPSSKTCSDCGEVRSDLALAEREFVCSACGLRIDRDLNAARNIDAWGRAKAKLGPVSVSSHVPDTSDRGIPRPHIGMPAETPSRRPKATDESMKPEDPRPTLRGHPHRAIGEHPTHSDSGSAPQRTYALVN